MPHSDATTRLDQLLEQARRRLAASPLRPNPREARLLLGHVLGLSEAQLLARGERAVGADDAGRFEHLLERRLRGEPVAYLVGEREFYGRAFAVDSRVLVPRPETEHLVEAALALELPPAPRILDIGTGSGCLAITLALERLAARVTASDTSSASLAVARRNALRHAVEQRVSLVAADLDAGLELSRFDLVISNPPYIGLDESASLPQDVRDFEPHRALFSPGESDTILRRLLAVGTLRLRAGAWLLLEIGFGQAPALVEAATAGGLRLHRLLPDYAGIPRVLALQREGDG